MMEVDGRQTVGMQRALYGHQSAILWAHFFDRLGFRLVLTPPTNARLSKAGIESVEAETCYPVKVSHGHVKELVGKTKYLFIPSMITMSTSDPSEIGSEIGSYCPLLQSNSYMVRTVLGIERSSILNPVINAKCDLDTLAVEISEQLRPKLRVTKSSIRKALYRAMEIQDRFSSELKERGDKFLENQGQDRPLVVVTGRPYNLYDERLNLKIGENLAKIGIVALPMDLIDVNSVDLADYASMYWGLGVQILRTAKVIKDNPNYFGLHLTNFGCGPDSFIEHFYKSIMQEKPHVILELDEHSAVAGVMTRLEAYKNVIENSMQKTRPDLKLHSKTAW
jgi:predicted nucleotide-binding protein (sugar kinase/HSP70/actin superfamily)